MSRSPALAAVTLSFALIPAAALADGGPSPGVLGDGTNVNDPATGLAYSALDGQTTTFVIARDHDGHEVRSSTVAGSWGVPLVTFDRDLGGISPDGGTLVLAQPPAGALATRTRFLVLDAKTLRTRRKILLLGDFSFDALAPDGRTLFLIQHTSARDLERYRVRAYDLDRGALKPQAIVDKTEPNMAGYPLLRVTGPGARWVYTLYTHGTEYFVHALDTVRAEARCLDLDWHGNAARLAESRLSLRVGGTRLAVVDSDGQTLTTLRLPATGEAQPGMRNAAALGSTAAACLAALAATTLLLRRRRRSTRT